MSLTDTAETRALDWINSVGTPVRPTAPLMCRLMTANGSDSAAGTEVAGDTYTPQNANIGAAASGAAANTAAITFTSLDSATSRTIVGLELWDSEPTTPVRIWWGALAASKVVNAGDPFEIPIGDLDLAMS